MLTTTTTSCCWWQCNCNCVNEVLLLQRRLVQNCTKTGWIFSQSWVLSNGFTQKPEIRIFTGKPEIDTLYALIHFFRAVASTTGDATNWCRLCPLHHYLVHFDHSFTFALCLDVTQTNKVTQCRHESTSSTTRSTVSRQCPIPISRA